METPVRVGLLGPFELTVAGRAIPLPARVRGLAAVLALHAGRAVPVGAIIDALWADAPPPSDRNTLQTYIAQLRRAVEPSRPPGAPARVLVTVAADAYRLDLPTAAVDALAFEAALGAARREPRPAERLALLDAALAAWRGVPLTGVTAEGLVPAARARLCERWREAVRLQAAALIDAGDADEAVHVAESALRDLPYDEALWALAVRAYGAGGRAADALAAYGRARRLLTEDLGLEPGPELQAAEAEVLAPPPRPVLGAPPHSGLGDPPAHTTACAAGDDPGGRPGTLRVVVAEDDLLVREGLVRMLDADDGVDVVATAANLTELLDSVANHRPDVVVTDICMPPGHADEGLQAAERLRLDQPSVAVLVLSQHADPAYAHTLLAGGARGRGYLLKDRLGHRRKLTEAVHAVGRGDTPIDADVVDLLVAFRAAAPAAP